jgi:CBS-domain-containing membrane protein
MEAKCAGDLMIPLDRYPHLAYWFTLRQAIAEMEKSEIEVDGRKSLPREVLVFNEAYELMGTVRRRDLLRGLRPEFLTARRQQYTGKLFNVRVDPSLPELAHDKLLDGLREHAERPVSEVMRPITLTVRHGDHLMTIIHEMVANDLSLIPVLRDDRVVGVVRSVDVLHEVAQIVL